ncbi:MAG: amino acid dehydrogenase [Leptothrix sp. (in: Bacteria)]|nr:amino acid dehydrogenase [Leptothrix sp. (in: b-proteobacteria)]
MRIVIVGAGIIGVTTAYELALQGHEVIVYERRGSVASEASFANGGLLAPGLAAPTAAPGMPWKVLSRLLASHARLRPAGLDALAHLPWAWRWWRACRARVHGPNRAAMHRLAQLSSARLQELAHSLSLEFEQAPGVVMLLRGERELKAAQPSLALLREMGAPHQVIDAARCHELEPGLHTATPLHAAIHLPQDGVGNCRQFAHQLKAEAQRMGARFRFDTAVRQISAGSAPTVALDNGIDVPCDAVVVCAGVGARTLLAGVGVRLPLVAVYGASITAPLRHLDGLHAPGPRAALTDERHQVSITRLGQRVRIAGGAEIGGAPDRATPGALRLLYGVLDDWFPGAVLAREAQHWKGAQPMLPDGPPVLGESGAPGVWLNLGHGASGWMLACGSARVLAEGLAGRAAPLDLTGLTVARLRS